MYTLPKITENALLQLRNNVSLRWLASRIKNNEGITSETANKLANFLDSLDDDALGAYVDFINFKEDLAHRCKDYSLVFAELFKSLDNK